MVLGEMRHSRNMYGNERDSLYAPKARFICRTYKVINKLHATFTAGDKPLGAAEEESVNEVTELGCS